MNTPPGIFDTRARRLARARSQRRFAGADFLHRRAADDVRERLFAVNRTFETAVLVGDRGLIPDAALAERGARRIVRLDIGPFADVAARDDALPVGDGRVDLFISILCLHAVDDLPGALAQIRRTLRPDGLFIGVLFSGETLALQRRAVVEAEAAARGGAAPRFFPFADLRDLGGLLQRAGFALPVADVDRIEVEYASPKRLVEDLRGMGETNALAARERQFPPRLAASAIFAGLSDAPRARFDLATITGWAPHDSQQKPLAPGSAEGSLEAAIRSSPT